MQVRVPLIKSPDHGLWKHVIGYDVDAIVNVIGYDVDVTRNADQISSGTRLVPRQ